MTRLEHGSKIPLLDLGAQYETLRGELLSAVEEVLASGAYILGPRVTALEERVAEYCAVKHAIGVASGSDALLLALMALDVRPGDEVIVPTYTFFATAGVVSRLRATPVFVDIDPGTYNLDPDGVAQAITDRTRAVIPVHLFGQCAAMDAILDLCTDREIAVIEDAAQAIGSRFRGRPAGSMGTMGCFSFYPTKNLGGFGDGGMITTESDETADLLRRLRVHGARPKYVHGVVGVNSRLDALQAALLLVKLPHLDRWAEARREHARFYTERFRGTAVQAPVEDPEGAHVFNQYVIRVPNRDRVAASLKEQGIGTEVYYPLPMHMQECFRYLGYAEGDLPQAERASKETLSIPVHPGLTREQLERVAGAVLAAL
jgi:dTDP-4-amino-4,6-dideoxygalactose transaminase